jgi:5,6,7,8-tetrahydromethanopterin hydro-lyase
MAEGALAREAADHWCAIVAVWVDWNADEAEQIYASNHQATLEAIRRAMNAAAALEECVAAMKSPHNPYFNQQRDDSALK